MADIPSHCLKRVRKRRISDVPADLPEARADREAGAGGSWEDMTDAPY